MKIKQNTASSLIITIGFFMILFSAVLTTMSHRKVQADSYVHAGVLNTVDTVRRLNYALSFGKPLEKYYGLDELLNETMDLSTDIWGIEVMDQEGNRILAQGNMEEQVRRVNADDEYIIKKDGIYTFTDFDAGTIILRLDISPVNNATYDYMSYLGSLCIFIFSGIALIVLMTFNVTAKDGVTVERLRMSGIVVLVVAQLALGGFSVRYVTNSFMNSVNSIAETTSDVVNHSINSVVSKGIEYNELTGIDDYLVKLAEDIPELSDITLADNGDINDSVAQAMPLTIEGVKDDVFLICTYDSDLIQKKLINNIIDVMILAMITVFISLEAVNFSTRHIEKRHTRKEGELYLPGFRLFVFVEGIAFALDSGFFSILATRMYKAMDLPPSMSFMSGMPNTMYSVAVLIGLFGCGSLIKKFGMKKTLMAGIIAGVVGYVLCAFASSIPMLIGARFIFGFCDGIVINAIRLFASSQKDPQMHTRLLIEYMAAINLGVSCGVVIGGLIADVSSYSVVFLLGAAIGVTCILLIIFSGFPEKTEEQSSTSFLEAVGQLKIPQVSIYMIFVVMPLYIASLYVAYTFPIFGDEVGFTNSIISGCLMINYILIAYLTDPISEWVMKRVKPEMSMIIYMVLQTVSIGIFVFSASIWAAILALVLTSLWDCFGMVVIDSALDEVKGTATDKCTLLQMVFGKLGMVIGPMAITARLSHGAAGATAVIVLILAGGAAVYGLSLFVFRNKKEAA